MPNCSVNWLFTASSSPAAILRCTVLRLTPRRRVATVASHREFGGPVRAGHPYIVGERRPEVFVPKQDGHIEPQVPRYPAGSQLAQLLGYVMISLLGRNVAQGLVDAAHGKSGNSAVVAIRKQMAMRWQGY